MRSSPLKSKVADDAPFRKGIHRPILPPGSEPAIPLQVALVSKRRIRRPARNRNKHPRGLGKASVPSLPNIEHGILQHLTGKTVRAGSLALQKSISLRLLSAIARFFAVFDGCTDTSRFCEVKGCPTQNCPE
jgi:hypothetical protein